MTEEPTHYWCVYCQRELPIQDGVIVHDAVPVSENRIRKIVREEIQKAKLAVRLEGRERPAIVADDLLCPHLREDAA